MWQGSSKSRDPFQAHQDRSLTTLSFGVSDLWEVIHHGLFTEKAQVLGNWLEGLLTLQHHHWLFGESQFDDIALDTATRNFSLHIFVLTGRLPPHSSVSSSHISSLILFHSSLSFDHIFGHFRITFEPRTNVAGIIPPSHQRCIFPFQISHSCSAGLIVPASIAFIFTTAYQSEGPSSSLWSTICSI